MIVENTSIHFVSKKLSSFFLADLHLANCGQAKERKMAYNIQSYINGLYNLIFFVIDNSCLKLGLSPDPIKNRHQTNWQEKDVFSL